MDYITTTQLRTKSKELIKALKEGKSVKLVHRSKVIAVIEPVDSQTQIFKATDSLHKESNSLI